MFSSVTAVDLFVVVTLIAGGLLESALRGRGQRSGRERLRENAARQLWRNRLGLVLALLAFFSQTLALPMHPMGPTDPIERAAVELKATFGDLAALCVQEDNRSPTPGPINQTDDCHCPLCQAGAGALAAVLPTPAAEPQRLAIVADFLEPESTALAYNARWRVAAQPRGPPAQV